MADQTITPITLTGRNVFKETAAASLAAQFASLTDANNGVLTLSGPDDKYLLEIRPTSSSCIATIAAGDGLQASLGDLATSSLASGDEAFVVIESARFKHTHGADADVGKVRITMSASDTASVRCFKLP